MQILLCPLEALSRLMMAVNESEDDSELPGIQTYCAYRFKSIFSQDGNLLVHVYSFCKESKNWSCWKDCFDLSLNETHVMTNRRDTRVKEGCPEQGFVVLSDRGRLFTNTSCFKIMKWQPRILKNAAVPTLGRILGLAKTGIQELELLWISIVYRLLHLLSCNLSKSRNRPS